MKRLLGLACLGLVLTFTQIAPAAAELVPARAGYADIVEKLLPAVVNISITQKLEVASDGEDLDMPQFPPGSPFEEFFKEFNERRKRGMQNDQPHKINALGSGFVIDASGLVVTNGHVVQDADEISVIFADNTNLKAELVGIDKKTDIAVLRIKSTKPLPVLTWGDSDKVRVGDVALAIGNPYGLGGSVSAGIISARSRDISSGPYDDFLQTDAAINRGNSGGPMFNIDGQVIGINTAIYSPSGGSVGIGFAIPANMAKEVVEQLKTSGHTRRGWLGVRIQLVTPEIATSLGLDKDRGALVNDLTPTGPADVAGIKPGDVILTFAGKDVTEMRKLPRIVAETGVNKVVPLTVWRNGKEQTLSVKVGELEIQDKDEDKPGADKDKEPSATVAKKQADKIEELGISVTELTAETRKKYDIKNDVKGVLISEVAPDSQAREHGVVPGDTIMEISQREVTTPADIAKAAKSALADGKPLLMLISHQGDARFVALTAKKPEPPKATKPEPKPAK